MFSGIVEEKVEVCDLKEGKLSLKFSPSFSQNLKQGASIAVDGVCLTLTSLEKGIATFDILEETFSKTTLRTLKRGSFVNVERSLKMGDEIGGHLLSGHVMGHGTVVEWAGNILKIEVPSHLTKYLFSKGFIAIDGMSLTLVDVFSDKNLFTVHLIPETLARTTIGSKKNGALVNIEIDISTIAVVDTVERVLREKKNG